MIQAQARITGMVRSLRRRWAGGQMLRFAALALAAGLAWLAAMILVDNVAMLGVTGLVSGWLALLAAGLTWLGLLLHKLTVGDPGTIGLARLYETRVPGQHNRLVNAAEFVFTGRTQTDPFAQAAVAENARLLDPRTTHLVLDLKPLRNLMLVTTGLLAALILYTALRPAWTLNALQRIANPLNPPAHFLATDFAITPGSLELIEGQGALVQAELSRNIPTSATIEYRVGQLGWTSAMMTKTGAGQFTYDGFNAVWQPLDYRVRAGRSVSPIYHLAVSVRPRLEHIQVNVLAPPYAGGARRTLPADTGDVAALVGSTVEVALTSTQDLSAAQLELPDGPVIPLHIGGENHRGATGGFKLESGLGSYAVRMTDEHQLANVAPPRFTLTALEDQAPLAVVTRPGRDLAWPADVTLELNIEAEDDIGLAWVALQTRTGQSDWVEVKRWVIPELTIQRRAFVYALDLAKARLKVNDVLLYRVLAADHHPPKPNVYTGRTWSVTLTKAVGNQPLLSVQTRRMLDLLNQILALEKDTRTQLDLDRPVEPIRAQQKQVREWTLTACAEQRKALKPDLTLNEELTKLADGPMTQANTLLARYGGAYPQRYAAKGPLLGVLDQIIAKLEELIDQLNRQLAVAEKSRQALEKLSPKEREQALAQVRDLLEKLRQFTPEQDKALADTQELVRKADNFTKNDLTAIAKLKGTEDQWAEVFAGSVKDIAKLTEQGFADAAIANDYKEMVEQIEAASKNMNPKLITLAVPREQTALELAHTLQQDMEMWLPNSPDNIKWVLEEPLNKADVPMPPLPDQLTDLIGDLISDEEKLAEDADDVTSSWADSISVAGWGVADGPISNFSAKGKTGNQLPNNNEESGRAGEGRTGRSQGQFVQDVARGLSGRKTPTRVTNDPYEQGVVKELQQTPTGGATGGGKARGAGQEGLQGATPPPLFDKMRAMTDWQQRIRQKAEKVAAQLHTVHLNSPDLQKAIALMQQVEKAGADGRYVDMMKTQQMVVQQLYKTFDLPTRAALLRIDRAENVPADQRRQMLDALDEPVPQEYRAAVRRYFENLSAGK